MTQPLATSETSETTAVETSAAPYILEVLGTFCLLATVGVAVYMANPVGALGAGVAAQLLFTLVLSHVLFTCVTARRDQSNPVSHLAIGVAAIAFLTFGSAGQ